MKKGLKELARTIGVVGFVAFLMWLSFWFRNQTKFVQPLPSQAEIQQILSDRGYDVVVDGVVGPDTRKAWDAAINNQYAAEWDCMYKGLK